MQEQTIFIEALEMEDPHARAAFLDQACAGDEALRQRIERLLEKHQDAGSFLQAPASPPLATIDDGVSESPGMVIGPYKLLEQIGEGGFGVVFMAEQQEPIRRKVALKILKAGMDTKQVIARFEAERQALALMDHPNIAHVHDGGATESGRPYFVMELVKGIPITEYCDQNNLTVPERLQLFVNICQAVQHAHQKGIIHRDIKPSNVLVTLHDGSPVVKVIDFGIAKAMTGPLTDKTLFTGFAQMIGTPLYMSPEQAGMSGLDVDTRSDVYSLGVLLYQLLTGTTPFDKETLQKSGFDEMRRIICEVEPPRPSARISTLNAEALSTVSERHKIDTRKFSQSLRGELDWIVMKALEKDRNRRYETPNGFAMDVQRYLAGEPVQAAPASTLYRLQKFVWRNKGQVIATGLVLFALIVGIIGTTGGMMYALSERDAKASALAAETNARVAEKQARDRALAALRAMTDDVVEKLMARGTTLTDENKEFLRKIIQHYEGFAAITANDADSRSIRAEGYAQVGRMRARLGELKEAKAHLDKALAMFKQLAADFPTRPEFRHELALGHNDMGILLGRIGRLKEAEAAYADALAIQKQLAADFPTRPQFRHELAGSHNNMGRLLYITGRPKEAEAAHARALAIFKQLVADFPARPEFRRDFAAIHDNMGALFRATGRPKEAEAAHARALAIFKQLVADFPTRPGFRRDLATSHNNMGNLLYTTGRPKEAEAAFTNALAIQKQLAADFPTSPGFRRDLARSHNNMGKLLYLTGRPKEAEAAHAHALAIQKQLAADFPTRPEFRRGLAGSHNDMGSLLLTTGRLKEAEAAYADALAIQKQLAADFPTRPLFRYSLAGSHNNLGVLFRTAGRLKEAEAAYADALAIQKQLAADFPKVPGYRNEAAGVLVNLANLSNQQRDFAAARKRLQEALPYHQAALRTNPRNPDFRQCYRSNLFNLTQSCAGLGDRKAAIAASEKLRDLGWDPPSDAYLAACALAQCMPVANKDESLTRDQRDQAAQFYGDEAMKLLRAATAKGFKNAALMKKNTDLEQLRQRADFRKLLEELVRKEN